MTIPFQPEQLSRWRLVLGKDSQDALHGMSPGGCPLSADQAEMDEALALLSKPLRRRVSKAASAERCLYLENGRLVSGVSP